MNINFIKIIVKYLNKYPNIYVKKIICKIERQGFLKKSYYKWNKFIAFIVFIIFINTCVIYIYLYYLNIFKFLFLYYLPIYIFMHILLKLKKLYYFFGYILFFIKYCSIIIYLSNIINDNIYSEFNMDDISEIYIIFKRIVYNFFYGKRDNSNDYYYNKQQAYNNSEYSILNDPYKILNNKSLNFNNNNIFNDFINSLKFFFVNTIFNHLYSDINILYNNFNISFKKIFNFFNGYIYLSESEIDSELNNIIWSLKNIKSNYDYIIINNKYCINNNNKNLFIFNLAYNLNENKVKLNDLAIKIERLNMVSYELKFSESLNNKICHIEMAYDEINYAILKLESIHFYKYYKIGLELNWVRNKIINLKNEAPYKIIGNDIKDDKNILKLFDLYVYNLFLENERKYYLNNSVSLRLGLDEAEVCNTRSFIYTELEKIYDNILYYHSLLGRSLYKDYYNIIKLRKEDFICYYIESNKYFKARFNYKSFYLKDLEKDIFEEAIREKELLKKELLAKELFGDDWLEAYKNDEWFELYKLSNSGILDKYADADYKLLLNK